MADQKAATLMPAADGRTLVLASGSRFRRQMLADAGVALVATRPTVDEPAARADMTRVTPDLAPDAVALRLAALKAVEVSLQSPHAVVIGADQVLVLDSAIYAKPPDVTAARRQLRALRGRVHTLPTAVVLAVDGNVVWQHLETPQLTMRSFSDDFLEAYLAAAGASVTETVGGYALEGFGAQMFERIEGDYFAIIGLPLLPLLGELRRRKVVLA